MTTVLLPAAKDVRDMLLAAHQSLLRGGRLDDLETGFLEGVHPNGPNQVIVFDEKDLHRASAPLSSGAAPYKKRPPRSRAPPEARPAEH